MKTATLVLISLISSFVASFSAYGQIKFGEIPVPSYRRYHLDASGSDANELFDGKITPPIKLWTGEFVDPHYYVINFPKEQEVTLSSVDLYDGAGIISDSNNYVRFYYKTFTSDELIYIGSFTGSQYNKWVSLNIASTPMIRQLVIKKRRNAQLMPYEIRLLGSYKNYSPQSPSLSQAPLKDLCGLNIFAWDVQKTKTNPNAMSLPKLDALNGYSTVRDFVDWGELEPVEGQYTMSNTRHGGWKYDSIYTSLKKNGKKVLVSIKNSPSWMYNTYPEGYRKMSNAYLNYKAEFASGTNLFNEKYLEAKKDPASYTAFSKLMYQYAGRYGRNQNIDIKTLSQYTVPRWTNDPPNEVKASLALVDGIEVGNEPNKNWHNIEGYMSPEDYAACLSAVYDGHKGALGPGAGIKNADPSMPVYMGGLSTSDPSYIVAMVEWCRENRGTRPDGSVDICWDVINYHIYSNNKSGLQYDGSSSTRFGTSYETSELFKGVQNFLQVSAEYCGNIPVVITETGWDWQTTPQAAKEIGERSVMQTVADWSLRAILLLARSGVDELYFYQAYDNDPTGTSKKQYFTSGHLSKQDDENISKRPVANFITALKGEFGNYHFIESLSSDPAIDKYSDGTSIFYACWNPSENGSSDTYKLFEQGADSVTLFRPQDNVDSFEIDRIGVDGFYDAVCTETPLFIKFSSSNRKVPDPPKLAADDDKNLLEAFTQEPDVFILFSENGSPFETYKGVIRVGNIVRPEGYWTFKTVSKLTDAASEAVRSPGFTLKKQSIKFAHQGKVGVGDEPTYLDATASSGLPITYQIVEGPGRLHGNKLYALDSGTIQVVATQPGDENFSPATPVSQILIAERNKNVNSSKFKDVGAGGVDVYPNPLVSNGIVQISPRFSGMARLDLYDMLGRVVLQIFRGQVDEGMIKRLPFNVSSIQGGTYLINLEIGGHRSSEKIIVAK